MEEILSLISPSSRETSDRIAQHQSWNNFRFLFNFLLFLETHFMWSCILTQAGITAVLCSFKSSLFQREAEVSVPLAWQPLHCRNLQISWPRGWQTFSPWEKWRVRDLYCCPERMHHILAQPCGWREGHCFIILEVKKGEKVRVLECWAQHHCPNEKVQVIKIHSYQRSQSRRKWADCSACQKTAAEEDSVCPLILTYSIKGKHSEPVEETLQTSEGLEWRKLWVENL